jgi:ubiquinol-cytochrome c reductase iron-sulfur subunit
MKNGAPLLAAIAVLGSAAAAALHANPAIVGGLATIALLAIAVWAGALALALNAPSDLSEPREPRGPSGLPEPVVTRGGLFGRMWVAALGAFALAGVVPLVSLGRRPRRHGTAWTKGARLVTPEGRLLRPGDVAIGGIETVFPEGHVGSPLSATLLLRLQDGVVSLPPERAGWVQHGNVAYSKICTHAGCPVAIYRHASYQLYCPCHQSVFDVIFGARPVAGPATRPLPQLGLELDDAGYLIARGDFADPVGPDEWWRTT